MTRINVVPVETLHQKHLVAEYRELPRIFELVRKRVEKGDKPFSIKIPHEYVLGTGHVSFFYNKLGFIKTRFEQLVAEMLKRGYNPSYIDVEPLCEGIPKVWFQDYVPTPNAIKINMQRIKERMPK